MELTFAYRTDGTCHIHRPGCADARRHNVRESFTADLDRSDLEDLLVPDDGAERPTFHGCIG